MSKKKRNILISIFLILLAILFTFLVKVVDVKQIGVNNSSIGFSSVNQFVFNILGVNTIWYNITDWLGIVSILMVIIYAIIGFVQLIKRKNILKVDKEILILGLFYVAVIILYLFFEKVIINYRPILTDGLMEASYPSSHTLMVLCVCGSSIIINRKLFNNKFTKIMNVMLFIIMIITAVGRLLSGVHWFTDILGGIFISMALLMSFYSVIDMVNNK